MMKKKFTSWMLLVVAILGFQANAQFVMPDFCTWQEGKNFVYIEDTNDWGASGINVYTWGGYDNGGWPGQANVNPTPVGQYNGHNVYLFDAPTAAPTNLIISNSGNNRFTGGNLTWQNGGYYNADGLKGVVVSSAFDPAARKFAMTGDAVGGWNMPPATSQYFTNNGDGTYTWTGTVSKNGFKLTGVAADYTITDWNTFNSGLYGKAGLVEGDNALTSGYGNDLTMPVNGDVTLTISDVTATSCKLNIKVNQAVVLDPAFYLVGGINSWTYPDESCKFVEENGIFTLTKTFNGEFKIRDENGAWLGAGNTFTQDSNTATLTTSGGNMTLNEESEYTLTIDPTTMLLTVTGFPEVPVEPYATIYIDKESATGNMHTWDSKGTYNSWPGVSIQGLETATKDGVEYYVFKYDHTDGANPYIIFNYSNSQTADIPVADGDVLKYLGGKAYILNGTEYPIKTRTIKGDFNNWEGTAMTRDADGNYTVTIENVQNGHKFKFQDQDNNWWGGETDEETYRVHSEWCTDIAMWAGDSYKNFEIVTTAACTLTFKVDYNNKLTITGWPAPATTYPVFAAEMQNGTVTPDKEAAAVGETVTLTVAPATGFKLKTITVNAGYRPVADDGDGGRAPRKATAVDFISQSTIATTKVDDTHYTFVIPEKLRDMFGDEVAIPANTEFKVSATFEALPLYVLGEVNGNNWDYNVGAEMTYNAEAEHYELDVHAGLNEDSKWAYFSLTKGFGDDWTATNALRLGGAAPAYNNCEVTAANQNGIALLPFNGETEEGGKTFQIPAGDYKFIVNKDMTVFKVEGDIMVPIDEMYIAGTFTGWNDNKQQMTYDAETESYSITVEGIENGAQFKFIKNNEWYGADSDTDTHVVHPDWCTDIQLTTPGKNFEVNGQGDLTFTVDKDMRLTITGWTPAGITLAEALAGDNGDKLIISDMAVVVANENYAIVTDGQGNWLKVTGMNDVNEGSYITNLRGTLSDVALNPVLAATAVEPIPAASITVTPKRLNLGTIHRTALTELKPNEVAQFVGYYVAERGELCAFSSGNGLHLEMTMDNMVGQIVDGKQQTITAVVSLKNAWDAPAGAPARVAINDDQAFENISIDATAASVPTGLDTVKAIDGKEIQGIYNVNGQQVNRAERGIYIIRYTDGTATKVRF